MGHRNGTLYVYVGCARRHIDDCYYHTIALIYMSVHMGSCLLVTLTQCQDFCLIHKPLPAGLGARTWWLYGPNYS